MYLAGSEPLPPTPPPLPLYSEQQMAITKKGCFSLSLSSITALFGCFWVFDSN